MKSRLIALLAASAFALSACSQQSTSAVDQYLSTPGLTYDEAQLAQDLSRAIQIQTISHPERDNTADLALFRDFLAETYPLMHARLDPINLGEGSLFFTWEGSDPALQPIVLLAHQDVVPVEPGTEDQWTHPPFAGTIADGFVWGRGALDMKGHLITLLHAIEQHLRDGTQPARTIYIALGADEEIGGAGARLAAARLADEDIQAWFVLDEGGLVLQEHPLTGQPAAMIAVAEKGYMTVEVTARARGGHSSTPPRDSAVSLLAQAIVAIEANPFEHGLEGGPNTAMLLAIAPQVEGMAGFASARPGLFGGMIVSSMMEEDATRAMLGTSIAPTVIRGGIKDNVLPQEASGLINLRLHPRDTTDSALAHLRASVAHMDGVSIDVWNVASNPPPVADFEGDAWQIIAGSALGYAPEGAPAVPFMVTGATDARAFADVADNLYRFAPVWGTLEDTRRIHGDDERLAIDDLGRMTAFFYTVIEQAAVE
jgi:carboxypeptidase PM20D1